ncbi:MAG: DUF3343 domain-containing protein [Coriobacteriia bacterium]|nr:DUF3343 domain-containing protein [Coriobacteriia bacterium]
MSERSEFAAFGFESTHDAIAAEERLKAAGIPVVPIPTPASLGALCGIALRVAPGDAPAAERVMKSGGIRPSASVSFEDWA